MKTVGTVVSIMLSACAAASAAAPAKPIKNIALVHGAFADGSSWAKVMPILQAAGYNVTAVQNRRRCVGPGDRAGGGVAGERRRADPRDRARHRGP